jgi:hypothetical protein
VNEIDRPDAHPRQMAQTIALPIMTNTTGRNHLSKNFRIGGPADSAAVPLEMWDESSKLRSHYDDCNMTMRNSHQKFLGFLDF